MIRWCAVFAMVTVFACSGSTGAVVTDRPLAPPFPKIELITPETSDDVVWVPGSWEREADAWRWVTGRWVSANPGLVVDQRVPVPSVVAEEPPERPNGANLLVPGHWEWVGNWVWVRGEWTTRPPDLPRVRFVPGSWRQGRTGWRWIASHWEAAPPRAESSE